MPFKARVTILLQPNSILYQKGHIVNWEIRQKLLNLKGKKVFPEDKEQFTLGNKDR